MGKSSKIEVSILDRVKIVSRTLGAAWQARKLAVISYFVAAIIEIAAMLLALYASAKLGAILAGYVFTGQAENVWFWLGVDIACIVLTGLAFWAMGYARTLIYFSLARRIINDFLSHLCKIDLQAFHDNDFRTRLNKVAGSYIWQLPNLAHTSLDLIYSILRFIAITAVVAKISWWLIPLIAIFLIPKVVGESITAKTQWFVWDSKGDFRHIFWGLEYLVKQAKNQMEIRSSQVSGYILNKIDYMNREFYATQETAYKRSSKAFVFSHFTSAIGPAIGSIYLIKQLLDKAINLETYFFLSGALFRVNSALENVFGTIARMQEGILFAYNYYELLKIEPTIIDKDNALSLKPTTIPRIEFKNVSFHYPGKKKMIFENLSFVIESGQHVALVGENGAGKSTLIKLLLRFYTPTSGKILVGGIDLNDIAIESWYALLATLFQDFNQYPLSIEENISIGRSSQKMNKKALLDAAKFGDVDDFVADYKHGWDTVLDPSFKKGVEPSGGQWQRVALARAFYRNANMVILDEPTSAIDAKAEYNIFNNIFQHYNDKTVLIVSHRFSTVRRADIIIFLEHGKIVEQGSHKSLIAKKGMYYDLFTKQAEGYRD